MNYEYKRVSGPSQMVVKPQAAGAIRSRGNLINAKATDGLGLHSPENMSAAPAPGCFGADATTAPAAFNVPIFRRDID